jgi:hypothetical protein
VRKSKEKRQNEKFAIFCHLYSRAGFPDGFLRLQEFMTKLQEIVKKFVGSPGKFEEKTAVALIKLVGN